jgi:hypothetical protein
MNVATVLLCNKLRLQSPSERKFSRFADRSAPQHQKRGLLNYQNSKIYGLNTIFWSFRNVISGTVLHEMGRSLDLGLKQFNFIAV